jgi:hypothetical protein
MFLKRSSVNSDALVRLGDDLPGSARTRCSVQYSLKAEVPIWVKKCWNEPHFYVEGCSNSTSAV